MRWRRQHIAGEEGPPAQAAGCSDQTNQRVHPPCSSPMRMAQKKQAAKQTPMNNPCRWLFIECSPTVQFAHAHAAAAGNSTAR